MQPRDDQHDYIPIVEEQVVVEKVVGVTDRVRVSTTTESREVIVEDVLRHGTLGIERLAVDREVADAPPPRHDGDLLVISLVEERLVKRLFVIEEVRIRQTTTREAVSLPTTLRKTRVTVEHPEEPTTGGPLKWQI